MSDYAWAAITDRNTVWALAVLAVYLGGVVGLAQSLPRALLPDEGWSQDTRRFPVPSAVMLTLPIMMWPVSIVYPAWRLAARRRSTF